jgi:hypothetical protein
VTTFEETYARTERHIERRYGIDVRIGDVLDPNTGDFNGLEIQLDYAQSLESALFVLIHLFGHTVQWCISDEYRRIGLDVSLPKPESEMPRIFEYERDAARYSLQLLHDVGIDDLDRWVSDWFHADWKYLSHFYRTGERLDFASLIAPGAGELLTPLSIPEFTPTKWVSRYAF